MSGRLGTLADAPATVTGLYIVDSLVCRAVGDAAATACAQLLLPAITLSFPAMATIMRFTRATLLEMLGQDYVRTARAKGATERRVVTRPRPAQRAHPDDHHDRALLRLGDGRLGAGRDGLRLAGLGLYATKSALTLDFMPIMGIALLYGLVFSVINILVDVTYGALDPRVSRA